jgi:alpha-tubulin suppressor-like RCC1 family protein
MRRIVTTTAVLAAAALVVSAGGAGARVYADTHATATAPAQLLRWGGYQRTPLQVALPAGVEPVAASAGAFHNLALGSDGVVYAWGQNGGALGDGTTTNRSSPVPVSLPGGVRAVAVSAGSAPYYSTAFSLALGADGIVYAWGGNGSGQLGDGTNTTALAPEPISLPGGVHAAAVSAGGTHSLALGVDGTVYAWGANGEGQLGDGTTTPRSTPEPVALPGGVDAVAVAAGWRHSLALGSDGVVYAWGSAYTGELGDGTSGSSAFSTTPEAVALPGGVHATAIAASSAPGVAHSLAIGEDGNVYAWGDNSSGELGDGTQTERDTPVRVTLPGGAHATAIAAGETFSIAVDTDGVVYTWGFDTTGQLGDGRSSSQFTPQPILLPDSLGADAVSAGIDTALTVAALPVPHFLTASPPATATVGSTIDYTFTATGAPAYALAPGAPAWLTLDTASGELTGTVPAGATTFDFSVTATNAAGSTTAGPFTVTIPREPVAVSGTVTGAGGAVAGAFVDACVTDGSVCVNDTTDAAGAFSVSVPPDSSLTIHVFAPPGSALLDGGTHVDVASAGVQDVSISLSSPSSLGALALSGTVGTSDGAPVIHWARTTGMTVTGCPGGFALASVVARNAETGEYDFNVYPLSETSSGSGVYSGSLPPQAPLHGPARIDSAAYCGTPSARRLASASFSQTGIVALLNVIGPQIVSGKSNYDSLVKAALVATHPDCATDKAAAKAAVSAVLGPLLQGLVDGLLPEIEAAVTTALAATGPVALIVAVLTPTVMTYVAGKAADFIAGVAVDKAMGDCPKPNGLDPNALIDPSGTVVDTNGNPIAGATVTIMRADAQAGPFASVDPAQPGIEPTVNPETTGADGAFHWDVRSGWYEVQAAAPACSAPGQPAQPTATIGPYPVPPPQLGLAITLQCPDEAPAPRPVVDSLSATSGPAAGGTTVRILGTGFTPASEVSFGGAPAAAVTYLSPNALSALSPAGSGRADVVVSNGGVASETSAADTFFFGGAPAVTGLSVAGGPTGGGTTVTVTGTGFADATAVAFGATLGADLHVISDSTLTVTTPPEAAGTVDVVVVNPAGQSATTPADRFVFAAPGGGSPAPGGGPPSSGGGPRGGGSPPPVPGHGRDGRPPGPPPAFRGRARRGALLLRWLPASDDVGVAYYLVCRDGRAIKRLAATVTSVTLHARPRRRLRYTVRAVDAAGNRSAVSAAVVVKPHARPATAPKRIPRWGWRLLAWHQHGRHHPRPRAPRTVPHWYPAWAHWRQQPFTVAA